MTNTQIKAAVRARDGFRCLRCGLSNADHKASTGRQLDVHRTHPGSEYSTEPGVCVTLCRKCHGPEAKRLAHTTDHAYPGRVRISATARQQLRTISALKTATGQPFKIVEFLNSLVVKPIAALHEATLKEFDEYRRTRKA